MGGVDFGVAVGGLGPLAVVFDGTLFGLAEPQRSPQLDLLREGGAEGEDD